jgi:plasmid stabilization system protein ParE
LARIRLSRLAVEDLDALIASHGLPTDTRERVARSLRSLEQFPLIGRELEGTWSGMRFLIGPWPWMLIVYAYEEAADMVTVLAIHDGRMSTAATAD